MTECTKALREQLAQKIDALGCIVFATDDEPLKDREVLVKSVVLTVIRQAPLDVPACDAEKAVLVGAVRAWADGFALEHVRDKRYELDEVLAGTSPAAAALLARGERLARFADAVEQRDWLTLIDIAGLANTSRGLLVLYTEESSVREPARIALSTDAARAALAPGEET